MGFFEFIRYCLTCMFDLFPAMFGHVPPDKSWTDLLVGCITLFVIVGVPIVILLATGVIKFGTSKKIQNKNSNKPDDK